MDILPFLLPILFIQFPRLAGSQHDILIDVEIKTLPPQR